MIFDNIISFFADVLVNWINGIGVIINGDVAAQVAGFEALVTKVSPSLSVFGYIIPWQTYYVCVGWAVTAIGLLILTALSRAVFAVILRIR